MTYQGLPASLLDESDRDPAIGPFSNCRPKSTKMPPPGHDDVLDTFLHVVVDSFEKLEQSESQRTSTGMNYNMTRDELRALKNLEKDKSIVIKSADKGGNLVVLDHDQYRSMCLSILSDKKELQDAGQRPYRSLSYRTSHHHAGRA